jgi:hypothetical protein
MLRKISTSARKKSVNHIVIFLNAMTNYKIPIGEDYL